MRKCNNNWIMPIGIVVWIVAGNFPHVFNFIFFHLLISRLAIAVMAFLCAMFNDWILL